MKRVIIITMGLSRIVEPIVKSGVCDVVGIVECRPRVKPKMRLVNKMVRVLRPARQKPLAQYAKLQGIPYFWMEKSDAEMEAWLKDLAPDLVVVSSMSQLLRENIFSVPKYGTINLHSALLPKYRGPNPDFWQYYNMDLTRGVTVHFIDEGEDTGDILLQGAYEMPLGMTSPELNDVLYGKIGVELLIRVIERIETLPRKKQPAVSPTPRARNIKLSEHKDIIDWEHWQIERVWHVLRGTEGWLNAISQPRDLLHVGTRWKIGTYKKCTHSLQAGKVYRNMFGEKYALVCTDGIIALHKQRNLRASLIFILRKMKFLE